MEWQDLGLLPYKSALRIQDELRGQRLEGGVCDRLLLVQHPPVFTMGHRDCEYDFISSPATIRKEGIDVVKTNRGGRVTYHGPGQLVGYFICRPSDLGLGVAGFVHAIEEICIRVLLDYDIEAGRDPQHPGVWVGTEKVAAIGLNVSRGVTQHGFALNVDPDLSAYRHIVACGTPDRAVSSMARLSAGREKVDISPVENEKRPLFSSGSRVFDMNEIKHRVVTHTGMVLSVQMAELPAGHLIED